MNTSLYNILKNLVDGKTIVITGSSTGIGAYCASSLKTLGAYVIVADIVEPESEDLKENYIYADVRDEVSIANLAENVIRKHSKIDILINNAAIFSKLKIKKINEITCDEWRHVFSVNVEGVFVCCKIFSEHMLSQGYGRIINIGSGVVDKGTPGFLHYVASKGAIIAMTRALAREFKGTGILVNTISPGFVMTQSTQANSSMMDALNEMVINSRCIARPQYPEDLLGTIAFLCSTASSFITGQNIRVDGGSVLN